MKPAIAAVLLDIDMSECSGLPLEKLLSEADKSAIEVSTKPNVLNEHIKNINKAL